MWLEEEKELMKGKYKFVFTKYYKSRQRLPHSILAIGPMEMLILFFYNLFVFFDFTLHLLLSNYLWLL